MEKLKRSPFYFVTNFIIIRKYFLFVVAVTFIVNGFFISTVLALSENITQINFTSSPQTIDIDTLSSVLSIQTQNIDGGLEKISETNHLILSSSSPTGQFYNANTSACTTEILSPFTLTMSSNTANKNFCYKDTTPGTYTLTISAQDKTWTPATQEIVINSIFVPPPVGTFTEVTSDISTDTNWIKENSPYVIRSQINVLQGVTLFINQGVIVKFDSGGVLSVDGKIEVNGTVTDPVYFTSIKDDSIGGDTNNDVGGFSPEVGDWDYLLINQGDSISIINNAVERYSSQGLVLYNGGSVISDGFTSDNGILAFGSDGSFSNLKTTNLDIYDGSNFLIDQSKIINDNISPISVYNASSIDIKNSKIEGSNNYLISVFKNSSGKFDNVEVNNYSLNGTLFASYDNSFLDIKNSSFSSSHNGFEIFDNSSAIFENLNLDCGNDGISVYNNSLLSFSGGNISCLNDGIALYNEAEANISGVKISDSVDAGVLVFGNTKIDKINITKNEITNNNYGLVVFNSDISVHQNNIHDNITAGAFTFIPNDLDFTLNYWGDQSGPVHSTNPNGIGDDVSDNILFKPFLKYDPLKTHKDPVILIPGITGSYLVRDYGDKSEIWPDVTKMFLSPKDEYLNDLVLNLDGTENIEYPVVPGDIIRGISTVHVFDGLISELEEKGDYIEGKDLFVFPYDWRKSTKENSILLKDKIDQIISNTGFDKVDIVAHSMGGLLAKKYIADNGESKIDQLIFLGTPQLGAPKAFKVLMYGDHMGFEKLFLGLNQLRAKYISQNMPSVYELLPSLKYVNLNGDYIINEINNKYPVSLDYSNTKNFLTDEGRNSNMFPFAEELHESVDSLNLSGIKSYNFIGCGESTIGKIKVKQEKSWIGKLFGNKEDYEIGFTDGDETVPLVSSSQTIGSDIYYVKGISHGLLPSASGVKENILAVLKNEGIVFGDVLKDNNSQCGIKGDVISTHSPVELHIYDKEGNHTGPKENGDIEYGVPGVNYEEINDINYVFLPEGSDYKVVTKAKDTGGFNLKIEKQNGGEILNTFDWTLVPLKTLKAQGEVLIGPSYSANDYKIKMDDNGDGVIDEEYPVSFDGTKLAEEASSSNETKSGRYYSGSTILFKNNKIIENPVSIKQEKPIAKNNFKNENIDKKEKTIKNTKQDIVKNEKLENFNLNASAIGTGLKIKVILPAIILISFVLILLAKLLLKL